MARHVPQRCGARHGAGLHEGLALRRRLVHGPAARLAQRRRLAVGRQGCVRGMQHVDAGARQVQRLLLPLLVLRCRRAAAVAVERRRRRRQQLLQAADAWLWQRAAPGGQVPQQQGGSVARGGQRPRVAPLPFRRVHQARQRRQRRPQRAVWAAQLQAALLQGGGGQEQEEG